MNPWLKKIIPDVVKAPLRRLRKTPAKSVSENYFERRERVISEILSNPQLLELFSRLQKLPVGYGRLLDERVVEYPWLFARLQACRARTLDVGSTLNFDYLLNQPALLQRELTIVTLAPEDRCYWKKRVNYQFCDARQLPFRDGHFDEVVCLSTIEHIGFDNTRYGAAAVNKQANAFEDAVREIKRVLRPSGRLFLSVPFGKDVDYGWYQQFDAARVDRLVDIISPARCVEVIYLYSESGWQISDRLEAQDAQGYHDIHDLNGPGPVDSKFPVASQAVALLEMWMPAKS